MRIEREKHRLDVHDKGNPIHPVMPGLVPGIHVVVRVPGAWVAATSPAMTGRISKQLACWRVAHEAQPS
jgi:hypothetical protein